jgi:hypothetical protein
LPLSLLGVCQRIRSLAVSLFLATHVSAARSLINGRGLSAHAFISWDAAWHRSNPQVSRIGRDRFYLQAVTLKVTLGIVEDYTCGLCLCKGRMSVTWDNRGVVDQVQKSTSMFGQDNLLLGPFNGGREVEIVCLLELLAGLVKVSRHRSSWI